MANRRTINRFDFQARATRYLHSIVRDARPDGEGEDICGPLMSIRMFLEDWQNVHDTPASPDDFVAAFDGYTTWRRERDGDFGDEYFPTFCVILQSVIDDA